MPICGEPATPMATAFWRVGAHGVPVKIRDRYGRCLPELVHNNIRCMYYGVFTQPMADAFVRHHLLKFDPFTGERSVHADGYGPTILAALEYITRMHGIHLDGDVREIVGGWPQNKASPGCCF